MGIVKQIYAAVFFSAIVSSSLFAADWKNIGPLYSGDMKAFVDYQVKTSIPGADVWHGGTPHGPRSYLYEADPLWINIQRSNLAASDRVSVQLITYEQNCYRGQCINQQSIRERDLVFAEPSRFSGQLEAVNLGFQLNDGYALSRRTPYKYELVVRINGTLYKGSDGNNLQFKMSASN